MNKPANLRDLMPGTAAIIDDLRAAFGADDINQAMKSGMAGVPTFWAREAGREIGTRCVPQGTVIDGTQMLVIKPIATKPA